MKNFCGIFLAGTAALLMLAPALRAQQSAPAPQPAKPKPPAKRVWTEDNLGQLRKPWDDYADQKGRADQGAPAQAKPEEKAAAPQPQRPVTRDPYIVPTSADEAEERIANKRMEIAYQLEAMDPLRQDLKSETNPAVRQIQLKRLESMSADLQESETQLKLLQADLEQLKSKSSAPAAQPPAGNPPQSSGPAKP